MENETPKPVTHEELMRQAQISRGAGRETVPPAVAHEELVKVLQQKREQAAKPKVS